MSKEIIESPEDNEQESSVKKAELNCRSWYKSLV